MGSATDSTSSWGAHDLEARILAKNKGADKTKSSRTAQGKEPKPRESSPAASSSSSRGLDDLEARILAKNKGPNKSKSSGSSTSSSQGLDDLEARILAKLKKRS